MSLAEAAALRYWTGRGTLSIAPQQDARLVEAARRLKAAGRARSGIGHLVEDSIRWGEECTTGENWKISNDYRSRYARKIMEENLDLAGMFKIRQLESA